MKQTQQINKHNYYSIDTQIVKQLQRNIKYKQLKQKWIPLFSSIKHQAAFFSEKFTQEEKNIFRLFKSNHMKQIKEYLPQFAFLLHFCKHWNDTTLIQKKFNQDNPKTAIIKKSMNFNKSNAKSVRKKRDVKSDRIKMNKIQKVQTQSSLMNKNTAQRPKICFNSLRLSNFKQVEKDKQQVRIQLDNKKIRVNDDLKLQVVNSDSKRSYMSTKQRSPKNYVKRILNKSELNSKNEQMVNLETLPLNKLILNNRLQKQESVSNIKKGDKKDKKLLSRQQTFLKSMKQLKDNGNNKKNYFKSLSIQLDNQNEIQPYINDTHYLKRQSKNILQHQFIQDDIVRKSPKLSQDHSFTPIHVTQKYVSSKKIQSNQMSSSKSPINKLIFRSETSIGKSLQQIKQKEQMNEIQIVGFDQNINDKNQAKQIQSEENQIGQVIIQSRVSKDCLSPIVEQDSHLEDTRKKQIYKSGQSTSLDPYRSISQKQAQQILYSQQNRRKIIEKQIQTLKAKKNFKHQKSLIIKDSAGMKDFFQRKQTSSINNIPNNYVNQGISQKIQLFTPFKIVTIERSEKKSSFGNSFLKKRRPPIFSQIKQDSWLVQHNKGFQFILKRIRTKYPKYFQSLFVTGKENINLYVWKGYWLLVQLTSVKKSDKPPETYWQYLLQTALNNLYSSKLLIYSSPQFFLRSLTGCPCLTIQIHKQRLKSQLQILLKQKQSKSEDVIIMAWKRNIGLQVEMISDEKALVHDHKSKRWVSLVQLLKFQYLSINIFNPSYYHNSIQLSKAILIQCKQLTITYIYIQSNYNVQILVYKKVNVGKYRWIEHKVLYGYLRFQEQGEFIVMSNDNIKGRLGVYSNRKVSVRKFQ